MSQLCDLPIEVLIEIFCRIDSQSWFLFRLPILVCRKWYQIITSADFWRHYHFFWNPKFSIIPDTLFKENLQWQYYANLK